MIFAVPLAWLQLTYEKSRLLVAIAGIMFAVILMFMQIGFQDALFKSSVTMHNSLRGDIVLISPQSTNLVGMRNFSRRRLYQVLGFEGVESVNPLYIGLAAWKIRESKTGATRNILVLGVPPEENVFRLPGVPENIDKVKLQDAVLFDQTSRAEFGPILTEFQRGENVTREVGDRKVSIAGLFTLGSSFAADGAIITSDINFLRIFDNRKDGLINVGLINLKSGVDMLAVKRNIEAALPNDVRVLTMADFIDFEKSYWQKSTAIGFIFTLSTAMAFIVGIVIVYQILYADVSDHLAEYATLKAMGYNNFFLSKIILQEAIVLSVLGFIPGFIACTGLYNLTKDATRLPMDMTVERVVQVLVLTIVMCSISGAISLRKVQSADPAEIFG